jgi:hypothetical protein
MVKALYKADIEVCRIFDWCRTVEFYRRQLDQLIRLIGAYRATHRRRHQAALGDGPSHTLRAGTLVYASYWRRIIPLMSNTLCAMVKIP